MLLATEPCPYKYTRGKHSFRRGVCSNCGATEVGKVDETERREYDAARVEFEKSCDRLERAIANHGGTHESILPHLVDFRWKHGLLRTKSLAILAKKEADASVPAAEVVPVDADVLGTRPDAGC